MEREKEIALGVVFILTGAAYIAWAVESAVSLRSEQAKAMADPLKLKAANRSRLATWAQPRQKPLVWVPELQTFTYQVSVDLATINGLAKEYDEYRLLEQHQNAMHKPPADYNYGPTWRRFGLSTREYLEGICAEGWAEIIHPSLDKGRTL